MMNERTKLSPHTLALFALISSLLFCPTTLAQSRPEDKTAGAKTPTVAAAGTPSEAVRAFYKALRERRFREAFNASVYRGAVEPLNAQELEELSTDFARIAAGVPEELQLTGEQISGEEATVFVNFGDQAKPDIKPVFLVREKGAWVVGSREDLEAVRRGGKKFFFEARIEAHHGEAEDMLKRIAAAQLIYSSQHGGVFGDLPALVRAGYVPQDILGVESTGYRFSVTLGKDGKTYVARAEPARHGSTGRLSFLMDQSGLKKKDTGGKPIKD